MGIAATLAGTLRKPLVVSMPIGKETMHLAVLRSWSNPARFFEIPRLLEGINKEKGINAKLLSPSVAQGLVKAHNSGSWKGFGNMNGWRDFWYYSFPTVTDALIAYQNLKPQEEAVDVKDKKKNKQMVQVLGGIISNREEMRTEIIVPQEYRLKRGILVVNEINGEYISGAEKAHQVAVPPEKFGFVQVEYSPELVETIPAGLLLCKEGVQVKIARAPYVGPLGISAKTDIAGKVFYFAADFSASFSFALVVQVSEVDANVLRS